MNYELAKQLKDAGFPENNEGEYISSKGYTVCNCKVCQIEGQGAENEDIYTPTLSELIEACGDGFNCLKKDHHNKYEAGLYDFNEHTWVISSSWNTTPEEAVARLWLELNK